MRGPSLAGGDDGRRLPPHFLVEDALGLRLRQGIPVGYGFDARGVPRGADAWGTVRLDSDCPLGKANLLLPSADLATVDARVARAADRSGSIPNPSTASRPVPQCRKIGGSQVSES